ncbi:hypothetical protein [Zunongwangia atlantica]|uniref:Transmembrane protein n=1 Tax=Zunongwangia atlantica 22II14-10F7 TaxID=1185767 RepID=A0A1Y1T5L2_9FLAO|nr:hypothetical protein [Zunongwangia atlantica]ORL46022.1 hypothetical protein IIF7_07876 [Zunongwangia atlantica 22II14-10F7]
MKGILKIASYVFHPIWMPFAGSLLYFQLTPRFFPEEVIKAKLLAISIITVFIPIVFFFLLKNLGKVSSMNLSEVKERKWPLFFFGMLTLMVLNQILDRYNYPEIYFYFLGILGATLIAYIFTFFKVKISLHMMGLAGFTMFLIAFSRYFHMNLILATSGLFIALGLTASSRLYYKAHTNTELILGIFAGVLPQFLLFYYWL